MLTRMDKGFTVKSDGGLLRVLKTPCFVSQSFDLNRPGFHGGWLV